MFMTGLTLGRLGPSPNEIEAELKRGGWNRAAYAQKDSWRDKILAKIWAFVGADLWGPIERLI